MSEEAKKNNNGFVGFLENLLLAKSVRHGFLLYFIIFNLDLILTLLGKGHIVKELTNVVPGLMRGEIIGESYKVLEYKTNCSFLNFCVSLSWRTLFPLACGFLIPIFFDVFQRWSIKTRSWVKKWCNVSEDALKEKANEIVNKQAQEITGLKTILKNCKDLVDKEHEMNCRYFALLLKQLDNIRPNIVLDDPNREIMEDEYIVNPMIRGEALRQIIMFNGHVWKEFTNSHLECKCAGIELRIPSYNVLAKFYNFIKDPNNKDRIQGIYKERFHYEIIIRLLDIAFFFDDYDKIDDILTPKHTPE